MDSTDVSSSSSEGAGVVDMNAWRFRRDEFARSGRKPLYVTHATGRIRGKRVDLEFEERIGNIRERLARINRLMDEIRLNSQLEEKLHDEW